MRRITCQFRDGDEFLKHLHRPSPFSNQRRPQLKFLANFALSQGEVVRVTLVIGADGERHDLHLRIHERCPMLNIGNSSRRWSYRAVATDGDAPWLQMLAQKYDTAQRLSA